MKCCGEEGETPFCPACGDSQADIPPEPGCVRCNALVNHYLCSECFKFIRDGIIEEESAKRDDLSIRGEEQGREGGE